VPLKVAIVGCGKTADMHVQGLRRLATARIVAVCDREPLMAEQLAVRYRIPKTYSDFYDLLAIEKPDVVHIATPPQAHFSLAMDALDAGCHLLVEKPLGLDASEAARIMTQAESRGRKLTIGYTYYFDPAARMLRTLVAQGVVGDSVHLESFFGYNLKGAFGPSILADRDHWVRKLPGKLFHNLLDHLLNQVTEFLTDEKPLVQAHSWQNAAGSGDLPDELRVTVVGNNSSGDRTSAYATLSSHIRPAQHFLKYYGTKCIAHLDFDSSTITLDEPPSLPGVLGRLESPFVQGWQHIREGGRNVFRFARSDYHFFSGFHYLLSQFYDSIVNDQPVPISYREILRTATLVDEIVRQLGAPRTATQ
jgi:predicted dehydrogenase